VVGGLWAVGGGRWAVGCGLWTVWDVGCKIMKISAVNCGL
jgi:hypothetical protein